MSALPLTNFVKVVSASNPSRAWTSENNVLMISPLASAETFTYASPCVAGEAEQSVMLRNGANPDLHVRRNRAGNLIITDNSVDTETFASDACFRLIPGTCGPDNAVHFQSYNEPTKYVVSDENSKLVLRAGDPENDPSFSSISCWTIEPAPGIAESVESATVDPVAETTSVFAETTNRTVSFGEGATQTIDLAVENGLQENDPVTEMFNANESTAGATSTQSLSAEAASGNLQVGASGGFGAGGGGATYGGGGSSSSQNVPLTQEMYNLILDDPGADLTSGNSGEFDFSEGGKFDAADGLSVDASDDKKGKAVAKSSEQVQQQPQMSALTITLIVIGGVAVIAVAVYFIRKYNVMEKVMGMFKK